MDFEGTEHLFEQGVLYGDNVEGLKKTQLPHKGGKARYMQIKKTWMRDLYDMGLFRAEHRRTDVLTSDNNTKNITNTIQFHERFQGMVKLNKSRLRVRMCRQPVVWQRLLL